ncbi:MAG TPA: flagellar brake protein, partial [Gammaproteobacteria bacterium]|nr:flagellar brake protein [Gammaproteobacteria bacterium]
VRQLLDDDDVETAETVLDPARIAGLLSAITFPPLLLNVALPGIRGLFTTALLQVNSAAGRILLDGLSPDEGHALLAPGSVMHVHGKLRGVQLDFATQVIEIQAGELLPAYLSRMPGSLRYHQRRRHFRLRTGHLHEYSIVNLGPDGGDLRGRLLDLSAGGLKGVFPRNPGLTPGQVVDGCRLSILGEEQLECGIEFIHVQVSPLTGEIEAGARFLGTGSRGTERLQRLLTKLQRQQLRHRIPE